jgi:hypothetical protein
VSEQRAEQPPQCVPGETDRNEDQQHLPERLLRDLSERTLLIRALTARAEGDLDREDADDRVDQPA